MKSMLVLLRFVSRPELAARPVRSLLMAGTVATGVALLTAMHVATHSIVGGFAGDLERLGGKADLQVTFGTGEAGFPEELLEKVAAEPFVAEAAALVRSQVTFEDEPRETVELFGVDLMQEKILDLYGVEVLEREPNDFVLLDDPRGIFVTETMARERGLKLGSTVSLSAVDGVHDYRVRGIIATKGLAEFLGGRLVAMFLPAAQPVAGKKVDLLTSLIDQIDVRLRPGVDPEIAAEQLNRMLAPGFHASTPLQRSIAGEKTVAGLRATLVGMSSLALLAAVFVTYASTTTLVVQRLSSMATLVTVGASPNALVRSIVAEAAMLGAAGSMAGVLLGLLLSSFLGEDAASGMGLNYSLPFTASRVSWDPLVVFVLHPLGGIATAAVSAFLPARRLRTVTPIALQREEDLAQHRSALPAAGVLAVASTMMAVGAVGLTAGVRYGTAGLVSAGGIVIVAASVVVMVPVLQVMWKAFGPILSAAFGISGRIANENLLRSLDRSLVTASAIALSVAIAVGAGSLVRSFRESVSGWYGFSGDALVSSRSVTGGWLAAPIPRDLEEQIGSLPSVRHVESLRVLHGEPYGGKRVAIAALSGGLVHHAIGHGRTLGGRSIATAAEAISRGQAVALSQNFAAHFPLPSDEMLQLAALDGPLSLPVAAIVPDYVSDQGSVLLSRDLLATHWDDRLVNYFTVQLSDDAGIADLARQVQDSLPGSQGLAVTQTSRMIERVDGLIGEAFADIDTIKLLVLFLTAVGITDLVITNVLWRRRELAVLRLVGLKAAHAMRIAILEALCVTVAASLAGVAVGIVCAWLWVHYNYPALVGYVLELRVAWGSVGAALALAGLSALVAATLAARYALREPALATVRYE